MDPSKQTVQTSPLYLCHFFPSQTVCASSQIVLLVCLQFTLLLSCQNPNCHAMCFVFPDRPELTSKHHIPEVWQVEVALGFLVTRYNLSICVCRIIAWREPSACHPCHCVCWKQALFKALHRLGVCSIQTTQHIQHARSVFKPDCVFFFQRTQFKKHMCWKLILLEALWRVQLQRF